MNKIYCLKKPLNKGFFYIVSKKSQKLVQKRCKKSGRKSGRKSGEKMSVYMSEKYAIICMMKKV